MKIRACIIAMVLVMGSLTACKMRQDAQAERQPDGDGTVTASQESISQDPVSQESAPQESGQRTAAESIPPEKDYSPVIVEGYQFVEGLGISSPGQPAFYQMDMSFPVEVKNEYASARLVNAVYQDNTVSVHIILKDYSVKRLSDEETRQVIEKEKQDEEKSSRGEAVTPDDSYFCIDRENKIYGRSKFQELQKEISRANNGRGELGLLYGHGIADVGLSFRSGRHEYSAAEYLEDGFCVTTTTLTRTDARFLTKEPEGVYELKLLGFEQPFRFEFSRVPEYGALNEIAGIQEWDGNYTVATGRRVDGLLSVICHTYPKEGYDINLYGAELSFADEDKAEDLSWDITPLVSYVLPAQDFAGIQRRNAVESVYDVNGRPDLTGCRLTCTAASLMTDEESEVLMLPIPEKEETLEEKVVFADGTLSLTKVERTDEQITGRDENGEEVTLPAVYVTVTQKDLPEDRQIRTLVAYCGEEAIQSGSLRERYDIHYGVIYPKVESDKESGNWKILGYQVPYREGETQVPVVFRSPSYQWEGTWGFPVEINGL